MKSAELKDHPQVTLAYQPPPSQMGHLSSAKVLSISYSALPTQHSALSTQHFIVHALHPHLK